MGDGSSKWDHGSEHVVWSETLKKINQKDMFGSQGHTASDLRSAWGRSHLTDWRSLCLNSRGGERGVLQAARPGCGVRSLCCSAQTTPCVAPGTPSPLSLGQSVFHSLGGFFSHSSAS